METMEAKYDIQRIMAYLPHRYPFLLVDRILELEAGERVVALKNVTINEPFFTGHFPQVPVMPGVLIVEAMGQAGGVLAFESLGLDRDNVLIYFTGIDKVRFRRPVVPGDQILFEVRILKHRARAVKMAGRATVESQLVAEAELMAAYGEKP
jgi:beta-hydroxyacyl-ACP dehydratase FabZ